MKDIEEPADQTMYGHYIKQIFPSYDKADKMKQPKTLADLIAMQPRERDAWFAEKFKYGKVSDRFGHRAALEENGINVWFPEFTTTNDGMAKLKAEMVKLGWYWQSTFYGKEYYTSFDKDVEDIAYGSYGDTEIEAIWKAAALALLGE